MIPFEQTVGIDQKSAMSMGGALGAPMTAFQYDWNMLPIGQQLWLRTPDVVREVPAAAGPPRATTSSSILEQVKKAANHSASE